MKILYFVDSHIKGVNPGKRKDVYVNSILQKIYWIGQLGQKENVDIVVMGGDLFDTPKVSNKLYGQVASVLRSFGKKIYVVPGNHDIYGRNMNTIDHTALGNLNKSGIVTIMTRDFSPYYFREKDKSPTIAITAQEYYDGIDEDPSADYYIDPNSADVNILVAHSMLLDHDFHSEITHTNLYKLSTNADVVMTAHYHSDEYNIDHSGTLFLKPRSVARVEASEHNYKHLPQCMILEVDDNKDIHRTFYDIDVALPGDQIFDIESIKEQKESRVYLESFKNTISQVQVSTSNDIYDILNSIAKELNITVEQLQKCTDAIGQSEQAVLDKSLDGFVESGTARQIKSVQLRNFQSHKDTTFELKENALNAIVGASDNGKTSIIRAIVWALYDDPKGSDFITHGESSCTVIIEFENGDKLTRHRSNSGAGHFETYNATTSEERKYTGFGHNVPIEVYNAHQMPKIDVANEKISLNIATQLEPPFVLSMSNANKANLIGKITKVDVVDSAIKEVSKQITNDQRTIKALGTEMEELEVQLVKFADLDDEKRALALAEICISQLELRKERVMKYSTLLREYEDIDSKISQFESELSLIPSSEEVDLLLAQLTSGQLQYTNLALLSSEYNLVDTEVVKLEEELNNTPIDISSVISEIEKHNNNLSIYLDIDNEYNKLNNEITTMQSSSDSMSFIDDSVFKDIDKKVIQLKDYQTINQEYNNIESSLVTTNAQLDNVIELCGHNNVKYKELLSQLGKCPICSSDIDDELIENVAL